LLSELNVRHAISNYNLLAPHKALDFSGKIALLFMEVCRHPIRFPFGDPPPLSLRGIVGRQTSFFLCMDCYAAHIHHESMISEVSGIYGKTGRSLFLLRCML